LKIPARSRNNPGVRGKLHLFVTLCIAFATFALPAAGAPRDAAAKKKIEEAIYTHFLNMDFDTAEGLLVGTYRACEDKCSAETRALLWMYVGLIRGSGRQDLATAEEAFVNALSEDPNVALDAEIASPEVQQLFDRVRGSAGGSSRPTGRASAGGMRCSLAMTEVQSRRPIPIECESDQDLAKAKLFFKTFKIKWTAVTMKPSAGLWRGTIPCTATQNTGGLQWYVEGLDDDGEVVDGLGDEDDAIDIDIVGETSSEPPAFPGDDPPARCSIEDSDPSAGGLCGTWGGTCGPDDCCETGLTCIDGTCEQAECEWDSDCKDGGKCKRGKCTGGGDSDEYSKNLIGVHFAMDVGSISSDGACSQAARANESFICSWGDGTEYTGFPVEGNSGTVSGGFAMSTVRALLSYDRLFGPVSIGARVGMAFNGGPALMPIHAELRAKYWLLGTEAFTKPGLRAWIHAGGGMAQIDVSVPVQIRDCPASLDDQAGCVETGAGSVIRNLDATKQLGLSFIGAGGGLMYAIGRDHGPSLNVSAVIPLPSTGFVIQPSIGYLLGF
jgi:hypothetical protein